MPRGVHLIWFPIALAASAGSYFAGTMAVKAPVVQSEPPKAEFKAPGGSFKSDGVVWDTRAVLKFRVRGDEEIGQKEIEAFDNLYKAHQAGGLLGRPASEFTRYLCRATSIVVLESSVIIEIVRMDKSDGKQCSLKIRLPDGVITEVGFVNLPF
jgi:hypothetical protein